MDYAVWLWNRLPTIDSGYSPEELFSRSQSTHVSLNRARVWGSPLYVLDPRLQDGKEIPKWEKRSTAGMFMGFSPFHSSTVSLALNLTTGNVSPQFHVVHDELFTTAHNFGETNMSALWDKLTIISRENDWEQDFDDFGKYIPPPVISTEWLDDDNLKERREQERQRFRRIYSRESNSVNANDLTSVTPPFSSQNSHQSPPSLSHHTLHELNQSFSPSSSLQEPTTNNESTEINNSLPSSPPVYLPTPTTTIPSEESSSIVPDK